MYLITQYFLSYDTRSTKSNPRNSNRIMLYKLSRLKDIFTHVLILSADNLIIGHALFLCLVNGDLCCCDSHSAWRHYHVLSPMFHPLLLLIGQPQEVNAVLGFIQMSIIFGLHLK